MNTKFNTTRYEFGCACVDSDARMCFELRYPNRNKEDIYEPYEKCGCSCHDKEDDEGESCLSHQ